MEEMLYSKKRDAAKNRSKFWKELYDTDTNKTKHLTKQEHLAQMFNASQQAVSKALKSRR